MVHVIVILAAGLRFIDKSFYGSTAFVPTEHRILHPAVFCAGIQIIVKMFDKKIACRPRATSSWRQTPSPRPYPPLLHAGQCSPISMFLKSCVEKMVRLQHNCIKSQPFPILKARASVVWNPIELETLLVQVLAHPSYNVVIRLGNALLRPIESQQPQVRILAVIVLFQHPACVPLQTPGGGPSRWQNRELCLRRAGDRTCGYFSAATAW